MKTYSIPAVAERTQQFVIELWIFVHSERTDGWENITMKINTVEAHSEAKQTVSNRLGIRWIVVLSESGKYLIVFYRNVQEQTNTLYFLTFVMHRKSLCKNLLRVPFHLSTVSNAKYTRMSALNFTFWILDNLYSLPADLFSTAL
jgi:hypothetical protein